MFRLAPEDVDLTTSGARRRFVFIGFYLPVIAGSALAAIGGIGTAPGSVVLGTLGSLGLLDIVGFAMMDLRRPSSTKLIGRDAKTPVRMSVTGIAIFTCIAAWYALVLSRGVRI